MPIRVLIVDDHAPMRTALRALLAADRKIDIVGEAGDGHEAVRCAERLRPDVVLMDISMPALNGVDATRRIRATCPKTSVIVLSMHASAQHVCHALQAGAAGFVPKESAAREVVAAVNAAHDGQLYLSPSLRPGSR